MCTHIWTSYNFVTKAGPNGYVYVFFYSQKHFVWWIFMEFEIFRRIWYVGKGRSPMFCFRIIYTSQSVPAHFTLFLVTLKYYVLKTQTTFTIIYLQIHLFERNVSSNDKKYALEKKNISLLLAKRELFFSTILWL